MGSSRQARIATGLPSLAQTLHQDLQYAREMFGSHLDCRAE